jgi:hypothetical protein
VIAGRKKKIAIRGRSRRNTARNENTGEIVMHLEGGCYCGEVRYVADGDPMMQAQCHCRECQFITGGAPNTFIAMPAGGFSYTKGQPKPFTRKGLERAVTREFCAECGTHLVTKVPGLPAVVVKVGTLDDPSQFHPQMAIYTCDKQEFHAIPAGMKTFEKLPGH